jgi:alkylated DNA repair dioxygenase AlkB
MSQLKISDYISVTKTNDNMEAKTGDRVVDSTITFTFGDAGENHAGMQMVGEKLSAGQGFTSDNLQKIKENMEVYGRSCELYRLNELVDQDIVDDLGKDGFDDASVLVVRGFVPETMADQLYDNHRKLSWDTKYKCNRRKKVLNKHARSNLVYSNVAQEADYENAKGTIVQWSQVPILSHMRLAIAGMGQWCDNKSTNLICEGNNYHTPRKTGIGWHGDTERTKVIAIRVGKSMSLCYKWWKKNKSRGKLFSIDLNHGDLYIMSEKSVGSDWKRSSIWTLRHSAGAEKYTKVTK